MTSRERVIAALKNEPHDRVPWIEGIVGNGIASAVCDEKIDIDWSTTPEGFPLQKGGILAQEQIKVNRIFGKDNIQFCAFAPIFCERMRKADDGSPVLVGDGKIKNRDDFKNIFKLPSPHDKNFLNSARDFIANREEYCAVACVRLGIGATLLSMGVETFSYAMADDPELIQEVHSAYADWTGEVVPVLEEIGFDIIWAFDDVAFNSGPIFNPTFYEKSILPKEREIVSGFSKPLITHSDGNMSPLLDAWCQLGQAAIHPIQPDVMDIYEARRRIPSQTGIVGNIDMQTLIGGTKAQVCDLIEERFEKMKPTGNYLVSSSNSLTDEMKPKNVRAMIWAINNYGWY